MSTLLKKLKSFFVYGASNSSSSTVDKSSAPDGNNLKLVSSFLNITKNPEENWLVVNSLGDGTFGKIYKMQHKESKTFAALKQVTVEDEDNISEFCHEVKVLCRVNHRNIIKLFEAYYYSSKIWMFLEFCQIGSVDSVMQELERPLEESQISCILNQLCQALTYLHDDLFIIHRDIKAANVLLTSDAFVKLADFGVSAMCDSGTRRNSFIGSPYWMAPEVIACETNKDYFYDFKADIWSLGIMAIEMAQMDPPWNEINPSRVTLKILRNAPPFFNDPNKWSQMFKEFLGCCLNKEPKERASATKLLEHQFLSSMGGDLGPLKKLIAEVSAEVTVEAAEIEEEDEEEDKVPDKGTAIDIDKLTKDYLSHGIISTNIDEELAMKKSLDVPDRPETAPYPNEGISEDSTEASKPKHIMSPIPYNHARQGIIKVDATVIRNPWKPVVNNAVDEGSRNRDDDLPKRNEVVNKVKRLDWKELQLTPRRDNGIIANDNFSFGESSIGSTSSKFPAYSSSAGNASKSVKKKKGKPQSGGFQDGLKVGLFGALASKQRLIGRSEEEGKALEQYRGGRKGVLSGVGSSAPDQEDEDDGNDGDVSSFAVTIDQEGDEGIERSDFDGQRAARERPRYKSLTKIRRYTYDGRPMTSRTSKVVRQDDEEEEEDASRRQRQIKKMDMRAMQLLQMTENRNYQNLLHHFKKQKRDLVRNFQANVKKCLKAYSEDLERFTRNHKQSIIKLQLQHDQEFNEVIRRVKAQQEKDYRSLQSMLRLELKNLKDSLIIEKVDRKSAKIAAGRKESENMEVLRTYTLQQRDQMSRLIDQLRFKHRVQQGNMENNFLAQKHDLYRACEGSIWKLEEHHLSQKHQLTVEQHKQMYDLQLEQARARQSQDIEQLTKAQKTSRAELLRRHEEGERKLLKMLMQQKGQRIYSFKEDLMFKNSRPSKGYASHGVPNEEDDVPEAGGGGGGDSGYMSLERKQIKEFERMERRRMEAAFRSFRLKLRKEAEEFENQCQQDLQELKRAFQERQKRLNFSLDEKLREEETKDRQERMEWQQSLSTRKRVLEEELERQKKEQERFFRNVLRSSAANQDPNRRYYEKYDRNFEHRGSRAFVLDANNYKLPGEFKSLNGNQRRPNPFDERGRARNQAYWNEAESRHIGRGLLSNSQMYKSTPDFISYWSGFDEDNFSNPNSDHDCPDNELDGGYTYGFYEHKNQKMKKFTSGFVNRSDDEISTIL